MSMNYERVSQGLPKAEAEKYATGIGLVNDLVNSLKERNLLPEEFAKSEAVDPVAENSLPTPETASSVVESNDLLNQAIVELKTNPFSPEVNTNYWRTKLQADEKGAGLDIEVPDCIGQKRK